MTIVYLILLFILAALGVEICLPTKSGEKGWIGFIASMVLVGAFLAFVYLTKLVILL